MSIKNRAKQIKNQGNEMLSHVHNGTRIELTSDYEAQIEGGKGVLEYDDSLIRIATKKYEIRFTGENLTLQCLNNENIVVKGKIHSVEFI